MADLMKNGEAVLILILGIMLTISMWYWVPIISALMPHAILKVLFWIGLLMSWGLALIATPISMIINGEGDIKNAIMGLVIFFVATITSYMSYYVLPPIIDIFLSAENALSADAGSIYWVGLGLFWTIGMILIPMYVASKGLTLKMPSIGGGDELDG